MSNPWTPGPWRIVTNCDRSINIVSPQDSEGYSHKIALVNGRDRANARLIAEAPAMAEALEAICTHAEHLAVLLETATNVDFLNSEEIIKTRAILARIKGEPA